MASSRAMPEVADAYVEQPLPNIDPRSAVLLGAVQFDLNSCDGSILFAPPSKEMQDDI